MIFASVGHLAALILAALVLGIVLGRWVWNETCDYADPDDCEVCRKEQDAQA